MPGSIIEEGHGKKRLKPDKAALAVLGVPKYLEPPLPFPQMPTMLKCHSIDTLPVLHRMGNSNAADPVGVPYGTFGFSADER